MNSERNVLSNTTFITLGYGLSALFGLLRQAVVGINLSPIEFGVYNFIYIWLGYANYTDLGINNGSLYFSSQEAGKGNLSDSKSIINNGYSAVLYIGLTIFVISFSFSFFSFNFLDDYRNLLRICALAVIATMIFNFLQVEMRVKENFLLISISMVLATFFSFLFSIIFGMYITERLIEWMLLSWVLGIVFSIIFLFFYSKLSPSIFIKYEDIKKLLNQGVPMTIIPIFIVIFIGIDRWILISLAEPIKLGFYALGCTIGYGMIFMIPNAVGVVLFSKFLRNTGQEINAGIEKSLEALMITSLIICSLMPLLLGISILTLPYLLNYFFPAYLDGLNLIIIVLFAYTAFSVNSTYNFFLIAHDKKRKLFFILLPMIITLGLLIYISHSLFGLEGAAFSLFVCFLAQFFFTTKLINSSFLPEKKWSILNLSSLFFPILICVIYYAIFEVRLASGELYYDLANLLKDCLLFSIYFFSLIFIYFKITGVLDKTKLIAKLKKIYK